MSARDALVERVAEAICKGDEEYDATPWHILPDECPIGTDRRWYRALARAALAAISATHVIGPRELPPSVGEMRLAVDEITAEGIWRKVVGLMEADHG